MVKKIRANDEELAAEKLEREKTEEFRDEVRDWMQRVDWKMWELLKVVQAYAEREGLAQEEPEPEPTIVPNAEVKFKPIRVEEEDV